VSGARSYSLAELIEATGFDRRTIVYYVHSGLLPKVGRRGPHTRYPEESLIRLRFIRGVKDLQAAGGLLTATLAEIGRALQACNGERLRDLLARGLPAAEIQPLFDTPEPAPAPASPTSGPTVAAIVHEPAAEPVGDRRSYGLADAGIRKRFGPDRGAIAAAVAHASAQTPPATEPPPPPAADSGTPLPPATLADAELGELLRELEVRPSMNARRNPPGSPEQWTEIPITSRVYLSVRGLSEDDTPLAEAVARWLKRALRTRAPA
jgi:hypothetical protein